MGSKLKPEVVAVIVIAIIVITIVVIASRYERKTLKRAHIWLGDASNTAQPVTISGDAVLSDTGVLTVTNTPPLVISGDGTLSNSGVLTIVGPDGKPLNSGQIWLGDASNTAQPVTISGDAVLSDTGVLTINKTSQSRANYSYARNGDKHISSSVGVEYKFVTPSGGITQSLGTTSDWTLDNANHRFIYNGTQPNVFNINWNIAATFTESVVGTVTTRFYLKLNGVTITSADIRISTVRAATYANSYSFGISLAPGDYLEPYYVGASSTAVMVIQNFSFTATAF